MKILFVGAFGNPIASAWWYGLSAWSDVTTIDTSGIPISGNRLLQVGLPEDAKVYEHVERTDEDTRRVLCDICCGMPDIIIGWWGNSILDKMNHYHRAVPGATCILIIDTLPNTIHPLLEFREAIKYNMATWIDGFISYSEEMTELMRNRVPHSRKKPFLALIEPFPERSYSSADNVRIPLVRDNRPTLVFTGRADLLFNNRIKFRKDAVGEHLIDIVHQGIRVFVQERAGVDEASGLETYPEFSNLDLMNGVFSNFISQFDGHLAIYNEFNSTIKRRVRTGLSTRLALGMTADAPIVVSGQSSFLLPIWGGKPFGFMYHTLKELVDQISDKNRMAYLRENMKERKLEFSLEHQEGRVLEFFDACLYRRQKGVKGER